MGDGKRYTKDLFEAAESQRRKKGEAAFNYHRVITAKPRDEWVCHKSLDPLLIKGFRECCDSDEHTESLPIGVVLDVTGSMLEIPGILRNKLAGLMDSLAKVGIQDPEVLTGAVGDTNCDSVPFQIGQFESDSRMDQHLRNLILEGGGGGHGRESYGLAYYFAGWKVKLDCVIKRSRKGYLFTIGDELPWDPIKPEEVKEVFGDTIGRSISMKKAVEKASEYFEIFHIIPTGNHGGPHEEMMHVWTNLLGQNVLLMPNPNLICELISDMIQMREGGGTTPRNSRSTRGIKTPMSAVR